MRQKTFSNAQLLPEVVKMLNEGHTVTLPLRGYSMRPFLENGRDKALLIKVQRIKKGDSVLAEVQPGHYVLHRIVAIHGDRVVLCGDGNLANEYCRREDVCASVVGFYRKGRTALDRIDGRKWRIYSAIWVHLRPFRRLLLGVYRRFWIKYFGAL